MLAAGCDRTASIPSAQATVATCTKPADAHTYLIGEGLIRKKRLSTS